MSIKITGELVIRTILWVVIWGLFASISLPLMAATNEDSRRSTSINFSDSKEPEKKVKDALFKQAESDSMPALDNNGFRVESRLASAVTVSSDFYGNEDIIVYDAWSELISDFNDDGFYHRFSVTIDADTIYDVAYVYARLYVSLEGGPWNHYATSDNYHIYSDSELDTFTVETELADGFPPGYYDIRIELYDADSGAWLQGYGPYDNASLSALPLEDSGYDDRVIVEEIYPVETQVVVAGHGGSMSWLILLLPTLIYAARRGR